MDERLHQLLEPVLRDLHDAGIDAPRVEDRNWTDDPNVIGAMLWDADGAGAGIYVARSVSRSDQIAAMADQVQEWAIETLWGAHAPTNWPQCPRHPDSHPLKAIARDGVAVWCCPVDDTQFASIGEL